MQISQFFCRELGIAVTEDGLVLFIQEENGVGLNLLKKQCQEMPIIDSATYTCIDKSDFQNGSGAVSTLYMAVLQGSVLACFEGYRDTYNNRL